MTYKKILTGNMIYKLFHNSRKIGSDEKSIDIRSKSIMFFANEFAKICR